MPSLNDFAVDFSSYYEALSEAVRAGYNVSKYADPVEGARTGLTVSEAVVAASDPSLIYLTRTELDFLDEVEESLWERVCGNQGRNEFARLAIERGQEIEDAWAEALLHAATRL